MLKNYDEWIKREQRIRLSILKKSPIIRKQKIYRICQNCSEVCLCHEETCPNCNSMKIINQRRDDIENNVQNRIRCKYRFEKLV